MWNCSQVNTLRPRQHGCPFADDTFKRIFLNENVGILIKISLKFIHKGPINNIPALVQIMAWRRPGHKPLYEPMMVSLLTHICVTRPQWVNATETHYWEVSISFGNDLLSGNKPLPQPMLIKISVIIWHHQAPMSWHGSFIAILW